MTQHDDEFYVGYLPLPAGIGRFIRPIAAALLALAIAAAVALASQQRNPGDGQWKSDEVVEVEVFVGMTPYPMMAMRVNNNWQTSLLVEQGKRAPTRFEGWRRRRVTLRGVWLSRDGIRIFELLPDGVMNEDGLEIPVTSGSPAWALWTVEQEARTFAGEVIDPKCYLGAMKPGEGKTHKACAALCLAGGIPPMLRVVEQGGQVRLYLLVGPGGEAIGREMIAVVGEPVTATGVVETWGNLPVLRAAPHDVRPR